MMFRGTLGQQVGLLWLPPLQNQVMLPVGQHRGKAHLRRALNFLCPPLENKVELPQEDSVSMPKQGPADLQSTKALISNGDDSEINKCPGPIHCQTTKPCLPCSPGSARPLKERQICRCGGFIGVWERYIEWSHLDELPYQQLRTRTNLSEVTCV